MYPRDFSLRHIRKSQFDIGIVSRISTRITEGGNCNGTSYFNKFSVKLTKQGFPLVNFSIPMFIKLLISTSNVA
ncbi:hypothetical protein LR69_04381 [Geobacillus sp. BCO2]|nr:hypothetical protein LR69_04381 [Geobacillus sp. BCO2]